MADREWVGRDASASAAIIATIECARAFVDAAFVMLLVRRIARAS
jgi:hypothetical protein